MNIPLNLRSSIAISPLLPPTVAVSSILKMLTLLGNGTLWNFHCGADEEGCERFREKFFVI